MNGQIIRYLALNGPSVIYSVAQHLSSVSESKVHYPTVNRRMHELLERHYLGKAGTRMTKAGTSADLYCLTLQAEFAALLGSPKGSATFSELSPKEIRIIVSTASARPGSPFELLNQIIQQGDMGIQMVQQFIPEIINSVRTGIINVDAPIEDALTLNFASVIARQTMKTTGTGRTRESTKASSREYVNMLIQTVDNILDSRSSSKKIQPNTTCTRAPVDPKWAHELKALLRLYSVKFD
jgi:hypothetical protein